MDAWQPEGAANNGSSGSPDFTGNRRAVARRISRRRFATRVWRTAERTATV